MARAIISGEPGEAYVNDTGKALWQFVATLHNTCGLCLQYHHQVGPYWPIPLHRGCNCRQHPILPGEGARPFADFRDVISRLDPGQRRRVIGRSAWKLVESGVVNYEDVVTKARVRTFREVVSQQRLSVDRLVKAGVSELEARKAYEATHTLKHQASDAAKARLIADLSAKGIETPEIVRAVGSRLAARVGIAGGPSGPGRPDVEIVTPRPATTGNPHIDRAVGFAAERGVKVQADGHDRLRAIFGERADSVPAAYERKSNTVIVNQRQEYWKDPAAFMDRRAKSGYFSTSEPEHIIVHEVGHAAHHAAAGADRYEEVKQSRFTKEQLDRIGVHVSNYARTQPIEFVAEVYAGKALGKEYPAEVLKLYEDFGGPEVVAIKSRPGVAPPAKGLELAEVPEDKPSRAAEIAKANYRPANVTEQRYAEANETIVASRLGGYQSDDNKPTDVNVPQPGGGTHGIELKTIVSGKNDRISMKSDAVARKVAWARRPGNTIHTVVLDHRDRFNAGENSALHSGHEIYYARRLGSISIATMYKVKDYNELLKLLSTPNSKLPKAARGNPARRKK